MKRLRQNEIKQHREKLLRSQQGICELCQREIKDPCLDHNHETGTIRGALCRGCNTIEGKFRNTVKRYGGGMDERGMAMYLASYLDRHHRTPSSLLHPTWKFPEEKEIKRLKKAKAKVKKKETKERYREKIQEQKELLKKRLEDVL